MMILAHLYFLVEGMVEGAQEGAQVRLTLGSKEEVERVTGYHQG